MTDVVAIDRSAPYDLFMLGLSLLALALLAADTLVTLDPGTRLILRYSDTVICLAFLADFVRSMVRSPRKATYFFTWGWLDLLSSIPTVSALRWGRVARAIRILRVLRGFRSTKNLVSFILVRRAQTAFAAAALVSLVLVIFSSIAVLQLEAGAPNRNIATAQDALWWAYVTITTVGYGDRFPVTGEGRILAAVLMTAGVGLFGTFTGLVASWFLSPAKAEAP